MARNTAVTYQSYGSIPQDVQSVSLSDSTKYSDVAGFMVDADGTLAVEMAGGGTASLIVKAGIQYSGNVRTFKSTGSSSITTVVIFY